MKLLLIITDYGSFNNFLIELAAAISLKTNIQLQIICSKSKIINIPSNKVLDGVKFHFVNIPRKITIFGELKAAKAIKKIIDDEKPDLIHSHFTTATFPTLIFKNSGIKYWATFHGLGMNASFGLKKVIFSFVELFCFSKLNKIFTINTQDNRLVKKYFYEKQISLNSRGVGCDINRFNEKNIFCFTRSEIRSKYQIKEHHLVITFVGRFVSFKGFHLVIKAFNKLNKLYPDRFKLLLIGGVDPIHLTGLNNVESSFLNNSEDIINIGFTNSVEQYLAITNIFLFPSKKEGLPTCVLEALSMGVPVITFDTRGNNDIIKHGYNGLLLKPDKKISTNVKNIVGALEWMKLNPGKRQLLKNNALSHRNEYSRDNFVNEQLKYYLEFQKNGTR